MNLKIIKKYLYMNKLKENSKRKIQKKLYCSPICRQIWKRKDTSEISGAPFLMGVLGGTCWCVYGYLKKDQTVLYVTGAQIVLYSIYTVFYWFMTKNKVGKE
jgi:uncharacterized protein with PQ loop repeat